MSHPAADGYQDYYLEKIWQMIPAVYRHEDGLGDNPGVLRALLEIVAEQAALLRRSQDRLWDDQFIELCREWAIPYIADLVGARLVSALNVRGRRVDTAKTIYYRRRSGTLTVLEQIANDITRWDGVIAEMFRRLGRTRHGLDPPASGERYTRVFWADLRQSGIYLAGTPFDRFQYTADTRQHQGSSMGRMAIAKLAFHMYRMPVYRIQGVDPFRISNLTYTFDPSGRDIPLFQPRQTGSARFLGREEEPWQLPAPLRCPVLAHTLYLIQESDIRFLVDSLGLSVAAAKDLRSIKGLSFPSEERLRLVFTSMSSQAELLNPQIFQTILRRTLLQQCGKAALLTSALKVNLGAVEGEPPWERITAGSLVGWNVQAPGKRLVIDPELGRLAVLGAVPQDEPRVDYAFGFSGELGAGVYERSGLPPADETVSGGGAIGSALIPSQGVLETRDNRSYGPLSNKLSLERLVVQSASQTRPYLLLSADWRLKTKAGVSGSLTLDGVWLGCQGQKQLVLEGDFQEVLLKSVTLDPGGKAATGQPIPPLVLRVQGHIDRLVIEKSILSSIQVAPGALVEELVVRDSVWQAVSPSPWVYTQKLGRVILERVTVLGNLYANRIWATDSLCSGRVITRDQQSGCFRFSAALIQSRLPKPFKSYLFRDSASFFTTKIFGKPAYAQLSQASPLQIRRGAENGLEMGAFCFLINPVKEDSLKTKVEEYLPFGRIPIYIYHT